MHTHTLTHTHTCIRTQDWRKGFWKEKGFPGRFKRTDRGRMTDRNWELVPDRWSLGRRSWTSTKVRRHFWTHTTHTLPSFHWTVLYVQGLRSKDNYCIVQNKENNTGTINQSALTVKLQVRSLQEHLSPAAILLAASTVLPPDSVVTHKLYT